MKKRILSVFLIISTLLMIFVFSHKEKTQTQNQKSNETAPISNPIKTKQKLLIFGADWCPACQKLKKELNSLNLNDFEVEIINIDENKELKNKFKIKSLPTSIILNEEKEVSRKIGYEKNEYKKWIDEIKK